MTNLDKLTEKDGGLRKEHNGVTLGIDKGKNTGITIVKHDPQTVLSVQLDQAETAKLMAYLGGKDLLCDSIKQYEKMNEASIERMEELRGTIRDLIKDYESLLNEMIASSDMHSALSEKEIREANFSIEKARKQLED